MDKKLSDLCDYLKCNKKKSEMFFIMHINKHLPGPTKTVAVWILPIRRSNDELDLNGKQRNFYPISYK